MVCGENNQYRQRSSQQYQQHGINNQWQKSVMA